MPIRRAKVNTGGFVEGVGASAATTSGGATTQEVTAVEATTVDTTTVEVATAAGAISEVVIDPSKENKKPVAAETSPKGGAN